jgi:hypothetical protein
MLVVSWYLIQYGLFTEVYKRFLCSGHNFLPCDRDFVVKKNGRRYHL